MTPAPADTVRNEEMPPEEMPRLRATLPFLAVLGTALAVPALSLGEAQEQNPQPGLPPRMVSGEGIELWAAILHLHGLTLQDDDQQAEAQHGSELVVIHLGGDLRYLNRRDDPRRQEWDRVVHGGGAALIATDGALDLPEFGLYFRPGPVLCDDVRLMHRRRPTCLYLLPQEVRNPPFPQIPPEGGIALPPHGSAEQLWQDLYRVCCNVSGYLFADARAGSWRPLARFPQGSYRPPSAQFLDGPFFPDEQPLVPRRQEKLPLPAPAVFAAAGRGARAEAESAPANLLAFADHSLFINQMLMEPHTDNWELARRVAVYLRGPYPQRYCRLYVSGKRVLPRQTLQGLFVPPVSSVPPTPPPPLIPDLWSLQKKLTELGNQALQAAQRRDVLNSLLLGSAEDPAGRQQRWRTLLRLILILASALVLWRLWCWMRASHRVESLGLQKERQVRGGWWGRGHQVRGGWWERWRSGSSEPAWSGAMQRVVRDFFGRVGWHERLGWDGPARPLPPLEVVPQAAAHAQRWQQQLQRLWRYAWEPALSLTLQQWSEWEGVLDALMQAHQEGLWRLVPVEEGQA